MAVKNAVYQVKNSNNNYDEYSFRTQASSIVTTSDRQFVSQNQINSWESLLPTAVYKSYYTNDYFEAITTDAETKKVVWEIGINNKENQSTFNLLLNSNLIANTEVGGTIHCKLTLLKVNDLEWVVHWSGIASVGGQFEHVSTIDYPVNMLEITTLNTGAMESLISIVTIN